MDIKARAVSLSKTSDRHIIASTTNIKLNRLMQTNINCYLKILFQHLYKIILMRYSMHINTFYTRSIELYRNIHAPYTAYGPSFVYIITFRFLSFPKDQTEQKTFNDLRIRAARHLNAKRKIYSFPLCTPYKLHVFNSNGRQYIVVWVRNKQIAKVSGICSASLATIVNGCSPPPKQRLY